MNELWRLRRGKEYEVCDDEEVRSDEHRRR